MQAKITLSDHLQLHFIVFIWGFTAILGELIESISSLEIVFYRTLIAAFLLFFIVYYKRKPLAIDRKSLFQILGTGLLIGLHWITFFFAIKISNISICLAGIATTSLWTSILEPLIGKKKVQWFEILLGVFIIIGLFVLAMGIQDSKSESISGVYLFLGLLISIISSFFGALFSVLNGNLVKKHNHYTITFYEMIGACFIALISIPFFHNFVFDTTQNILPTNLEWFYIFILSAICTVFAYTLSIKLMHKFTAFAINLTVNLEPIYGILLAYVFFNERMSISFYFGTAIILMAVIAYPYLNKYFTKIKPQKNQPEVLEIVEVQMQEKESVF